MSIVERLAPPPGAVLVRVAAHGPDWIERVPTAPRGESITVSVSDVALRDVPSSRLLASGYRIVGVHPWRGAGEGGSVDLLVTAAVIDRWPAWWRELIHVADRAFDLRLGPVQRVMGQELALHLAG